MIAVLSRLLAVAALIAFCMPANAQTCSSTSPGSCVLQDDGVARETPTLGENGGTGGNITLKGATSGSVTIAPSAAAGSGTVTLPTASLNLGAIPNSNLATMPANTIKGNNTGSASTPINLTTTQLLAMYGVPTDLYGAQGSFWTDVNDADGNMNARIHRYRDRIFVDDGAIGTGGFTTPNSASRSGAAINSVQWGWAPQQASLLSINSWGLTGIAGMSVVSQQNRTGQPITTAVNRSSIGVSGFSLNDDATGVGTSWALYGEALRKAGGGFTTGLELDAGNGGSVVDITPYANTNGFTVGLWDACGGSSSPAVTYANCSAAIVMTPNGAAWRKGIVFKSTALDTTLGAGGGGVAAEMALGQSYRWVNSGGSTAGEFWGDSSGLHSQGSFADNNVTLDSVTNGFSQTIPTGQNNVILSVSGTIASGSVTLPQFPSNGYPIRISTNGTITALTVSVVGGSGQTNNCVTSGAQLSGTNTIRCIYYAPFNAWYPN